MKQIINGHEFENYGHGWVEIYYDGTSGSKEGIYHCPIISWEFEPDSEYDPNGEWSADKICAFGMGFNGDGTRPCDGTKILRHLKFDEIGILDGHTPVYESTSEMSYDKSFFMKPVQ